MLQSAPDKHECVNSIPIRFCKILVGGRMWGLPRLASCSPLVKMVSHYISGQQVYSIMQKHLKMLVLILLAGTCQTLKVTRSNRGGGLIISGGVINLQHAPASRRREKQKAQPSLLTHSTPPHHILLALFYQHIIIQLESRYVPEAVNNFAF